MINVFIAQESVTIEEKMLLLKVVIKYSNMYFSAFSFTKFPNIPQLPGPI